MKNYFLFVSHNIFYTSTFLIIASIYLSPIHAQTFGGHWGTPQDNWVVNDDRSNHYSILRLQTSNNKAVNMINKGDGYLRWYFSTSTNNFNSMGRELMNLSTEGGRLRLRSHTNGSGLFYNTENGNGSWFVGVDDTQDSFRFWHDEEKNILTLNKSGDVALRGLSLDPIALNDISYSNHEGLMFYGSVFESSTSDGYFEDKRLMLNKGDSGWANILDSDNITALEGRMKSLSVYDHNTIFQYGDLAAKRLVLSNSELSDFNELEGTLYYDRNFYFPDEAGQDFFDNDGGGLVLNNGDDGWSAIIDTQNMSHLNAEFKSIKIPSGVANAEEYHAIIGNYIGGGYGDFGIKTNQGNINLESNGTVRIKSFEANTISIGDDNDMITINGEIRAKNQYAFTTDDVRLGNGAGEGVSNQDDRRHVFIGHDAGTKSAFDDISLIDYEDSDNSDPVTGSEYIENHSVFVLNNHQDLHKPLLFGKFAHEGSQNSMAQLAINTHHVVDSVALTVSGAVHIGPKNIDPTLFPSKEGYEDALLWVERGIVTEDVTYAFTSDWDNWPDYVFEKNYDLIPLIELEKYIQENRHLPGILSREDVKSKGVKSKEMIIALLTKIEELTLYTIEQKKQIDNQRQLNDEMQSRLTKLENLMLNLARE